MEWQISSTSSMLAAPPGRRRVPLKAGTMSSMVVYCQAKNWTIIRQDLPWNESLLTVGGVRVLPVLPRLFLRLAVLSSQMFLRRNMSEMISKIYFFSSNGHENFKGVFDNYIERKTLQFSGKISMLYSDKK